MYKLKNIYKQLLLELSPKEIKDKYYSEIPDKDFYDIVTSDPKTKEENGNVVKIGKYSKILLSLYMKGNLKLEDLPKANEYLTYVYKHNVPLKINDINDLSDIFKLVNKYILRGETSISEFLKDLNPNEYEIPYQNDKWIIFIPKTERAACYIGSNTEWCTSWGKYSTSPKYKDRSNYFKSYNETSPLYIIINKDDNRDKYQFHFSSGQFMDVNDKRINLSSFIQNNPDIGEYFLPGLYKKLSKEEKENNIDKWHKLPDNITNLYIKKQYGDDNNPAIKMLISGDFNQIMDELNSNGIYDIDIFSGYLGFTIDSRYDNALTDYFNKLKNINEVDQYDEEYFFKKYEDVINDYKINFYREFHKNNKSVIIRHLGSKYSDSNKFADYFMELDYDNQDLVDSWFDFIDHIIFESGISDRIRSFFRDSVINFDSNRDSYEIEIPRLRLINYIDKFNIRNLNNFIDIIYGYIVYYNDLEILDRLNNDISSLMLELPEYTSNIRPINSLKRSIQYVIKDSYGCTVLDNFYSSIIDNYSQIKKDDVFYFENKYIILNLYDLTQICYYGAFIEVEIINKRSGESKKVKTQYFDLEHIVDKFMINEEIMRFSKNLYY